MAKRTPKHFCNAKEFDAYILGCAIRDREGFLDSLAGCDGPEFPEFQQAARETRAEITAMQERQSLLQAKLKSSL